MPSKLPSGNRFLVVPQKELTKDSIAKQAKKAKESAERRAPIVNKEINRRIDYARQAQRTYSGTSWQGRDYNIAKTVETIKDIANVVSHPFDNTSVRPSSAYSFAYKGGQYSGAGTQARETLKSIVPEPGNMVELARFAAKRDTATDEMSMKFYDKYSLSHSETGPDAHDLLIGRGQDWMTDNEALTEWILGGLDFESGNITEADLEAARRRQEQYEDYMSRYLKDVPVFNPDQFGPQTEKQFTEDAPLPPWIPSTAANVRTWDYYKTYSHDVVQTTVDRYKEFMEEQREFAKTPYKSAFSTEKNEGDVDSFLDILVSSRSANDLRKNTANYFRDYIVNPLKAGKILTAGGNALWNMMDTMDFAARGVRALVAGSTVLGGRNTTFEGQKVYWAKLQGYTDEESQRAQRIFMENGGYELLLKAHPGEATKADLASADSGMTKEELIAKLNEAFAKEGINWRTIYKDLDENYFKNRGLQDLSQAVENVKTAYSDPAAAFNADTGSLGGDIIIESVLDPGLIVGGLSKNIASGTLESSAKLAMKDGLTRVLESSDDATMIMKDKRVVRALNAFIGSNEGKNIIFKDSKKFGDDVGVLIRTLEKDMPHLFADNKAKKEFGDVISAHLFSKNQNINSKIIESTGWARNALDTKTFRAAYAMDKAIDRIDSAIIKSSFAAPWGLVKGLKRGKRFVLNNTAVGQYYFNKRMRQALAARTVRDEVTKAVDVTSLPKLMDKFSSGQLDREALQAGLKDITKAYDNTARKIPYLTQAVAEGKMTAEDAMRTVGDEISAFTGGKYKSVDELIAQVNSYDVSVTGDVSAAYDRLVRNFDVLEKTAYRKSDAAIADFLTEVSHVENVDDLRRLFRDNMDNETIMSLRSEVAAKVPFDITDAEVDEIVTGVRNGLFSDTPVTSEGIRKAVRHIEHASNSVVDRTVKVRDIKRLLEHNYSYLLDTSDEFLKKNSYVRKLRPLFELTRGSKNEITLKEAIDCIESAKRSLMTSGFLRANEITSETAGLVHMDPRMADLRRLKDTIRGLDVVSLKSNEVINIMHVDRMAMMQKYMSNSAIKKVYGADYDAMIAPVLDTLDSMTTDNVNLATDAFVQDVLRLRELKYGRDRTEILKSELKGMHMMSDQKLHTLLTGLGNNFGRAHGTLTDTLSTPGLLRRNLETTLRTQFGEQKLGMAGLTDMLKSLDSGTPHELLAPYVKEFDDPVKGAALRARYNKIVDASPLDPNAYVKKQMLVTLLMDPTLVNRYNALAEKGSTPIFFHINTTGLNSEISEIASISCIKWTHIDVSDADPLTLEKVLDAIPDEPTLFKQGMSSAQLDGISENVLRRMDMKGLTSRQLRDAVSNTYRLAEGAERRTEADVIEDFCRFISDELQVSKKGQANVPTLVAHDLDGFNVNYFNKRAAQVYDSTPDGSKVRGYFDGQLSRRVKEAADNTYEQLAPRVGDNSFSDEELNDVERILTAYADDINRYAGDNFDPFDFEEYGKTFERVLYESTNNADDDLKAIRDSIAKASSGGAVDMEAYKHAMQDIADFAKYPKRFAFISDDSQINAVNTALKVVGKDSVNMESRIYVRDVMSYFDVSDGDTGQIKANIAALQKMHNLSQYVIRNRDHSIAAGAEEFLAPYKDQFDDVIDAVRNIGSNYSSGSEYSFLANIRTPETAVESYLLSQKLYDDYIKYWCFGEEAETIGDRIAVLNSYKEKLGAIYAQTSVRVDELYDKTKALSKEQWSLFKSSYATYKAESREQFSELSRELWSKYRQNKSGIVDAYEELNDELWDAYASQGDLASKLYREAKESTQAMWDEYRIDKEYAQMLKQEARENTEHLWDEYRVRKAQLDEYYKQLKEETDRVVASWDASKKLRSQFSADDIERLAAGDLDYFYRYKDFRDAFEQIDWKGYKQAKDSLADYRKMIHTQHDEFYKDYLDQLAMMRKKYDFEAMRAKADAAWSAFNEAALTKSLMKPYTKAQAAELRDMYFASISTLYHEAKADSDELYQMYINSLDEFRSEGYHNTMQVTNLLWSLFTMDKADLWKAYETDPERLQLLEEFFDELMSYFNDYRPRVFDEFTNKGTMQGFDSLLSKEYDEIFSLFEGGKRPEIFKTEAKSDYFRTIYSYRDGTMSQGIDMATKLSEANSTVASSLRQLDWIDRFYINAGIETQTDRLTGMLHMKAKTLFDMLDATDISRRPSFRTFMEEASNAFHMKVRQYALDSLRVDGKFNQDRLVSELIYNDLNHVVFNSNAYSVAEMDELRKAVRQFQKDGADYLSMYEDRSTGNIFVYLNYNAEVASDGKQRFLNGKLFEKPVKDAVDLVDFDELVSTLQLEDVEDFRSIYEHLRSCWEDTRMLSQGDINGTSGKLISRRQAEEYLETIPSGMGDMLSPKGILLSDTARAAVYDPGFVRNEDSDILLDYLETLSRQADIAKEDAILVNEVFSSDSTLQFSELSRHFSDEELMQYFGNNPDYVVVTLTPNANTRTGLQVERLKVDNLASLEVAKNTQNTTILPYDMYYEVADIMNRVPQDGYYRRLLGKYLLLYKAFALVKPGTWIRNYIDATTKAAIDNGEDITNVFNLMSYQGKAARDLSTYSKIIKADPALLNKSNWDIIQRTFKTDMTYDDFDLLKGVIDAEHFKSADKALLENVSSRNSGLKVISGENIGLRNLDEDDIIKAFTKYMKDELDLPLSQADFIDIYLGRVKPDREVAEQFEDMMRKLSTNMRNADASDILEKTVNFMFKPFGAVESLARYSQTMYLRDMGLSANQTLKHIHATQFYTAPSWGTFSKLETIMPFITFRYNNFMYWMRMMDENPRFFRYFEDVYGTISEDTIENMIENGQESEYSEDSFWQNGAIPLGDSGLNIKVGNSFLSAINDFYGGPDMLIGRQGGLNPLLRETLRFSSYALGLQSKEFFSDVDLDVEKDLDLENLVGLLPGGNLAVQAKQLITKLPNTFDDNGPTMDTLFQTLSFMGVLGIRRDYTSGGNFDYNEWLNELASQGKWFDSNLGKIVPLSDKNTYGANDPNISWEDRQAYMMVHFGKIWDPNQSKFVTKDQLMDGNLDMKFDFENDPEAWNKLQKWMKLKGKVYDYNQRKFVLEKDFISGGLNDPNLTFEEKSQLMYDKFGLRWDGNQNTYVTDDKYIAGGLNDTKNFNEVKSLRLAMYGEVWDRAQHKFVKVQDPKIVTIGKFFRNEEYDEYFSRLAIPRLQNVDLDFHVNSEGLLVTEDGRYILTNNPEYNSRIFDKFKYTFSSGGRRYSRWKNYSYNKFKKSDKPYKGRTMSPTYYTGFGWNDQQGYYRLAYEYSYQYHSPQPASKLHRLISPPKFYPYGGGYGKYSFYSR